MKTHSKGVIIVVEDNKAEQEETVLALQLSGFNAIGANNSTELDQLVAIHVVDIIILDLDLPGEDGLEVASRWQQQHPTIGIIMLTGSGLMQQRLLGLQAGADAYLVKPTDPRELIATIEAFRRRYENRKAANKKGFVLSHGGLRLASLSEGTEMNLTDLQRRLLMKFKDVKAGHPMSREALMEALGYEKADSEGDYHRLETLVSRLRVKIRTELKDELPLQALPNQGYALTGPIIFKS
jgi:DNA-binding response OmpR family regulator